MLILQKAIIFNLIFEGKEIKLFFMWLLGIYKLWNYLNYQMLLGGWLPPQKNPGSVLPKQACMEICHFLLMKKGHLK